ncbi:hypothetical protein C6H66_18105 [Photorhabdus hindustanensis]|uniref:Uncharacterized protein n=1 Tax=Photorhabdus hindustanensis TaxID=2918802 RepID=A0A2S8QFS4_9GAMM|nr:hypothetical protein C6H66_18105 [Photorhabdus hindustanensis]PQQ34156.1 hypothetical protein C6H69_07360 [Photorhabdus luminescens]
MRKRAAKKGNSVMVKRIYISAINNDYNGKMILVDNYFFTIKHASQYYAEMIKNSKWNNPKVVYNLESSSVGK